MARTLIIGLSFLVVSCSDPVSPVRSGEVEAGQTFLGIVLTNPDQEPLYYFAVEREFLARINWAPCAGESCRAVEPESRKLIRYSSIAGWTDRSQEVVVHWWRAELIEGEWQIGSVNSLVIGEN